MGESYTLTKLVQDHLKRQYSSYLCCLENTYVIEKSQSSNSRHEELYFMSPEVLVTFKHFSPHFVANEETIIVQELFMSVQ